MRTKVCVLVLTLASSLLVGCSSQTKTDTNANAAKPAASAAASPVAENKIDELTDNLVRYEEGGIQFTAPVGWGKELDSSVATLKSPNGEAEIMVYAPASADYEQATKDVESNLGKYIRKVAVVSKGTADRLNGMQTYSVGGTGEKDGKPVVWKLTIGRARKAVYVLFVGVADTFPKHEAAYAALTRSIRPLP